MRFSYPRVSVIFSAVSLAALSVPLQAMPYGVCPDETENLEFNRKASEAFETEVSGILQNSDGIGIGESHGEKAFAFIKNNLDFFKREGVQTIYTEMLEAQNNGWIKEYYRFPTPDKKMKLMDVYGELSTIHYFQREIFADLVDEAYQRGIRIVGIDLQPRPKEDDPHLQISNPFMENMVGKDRKSNGAGKYIIHVGLSHMAGDVEAKKLPDYDPANNLAERLSIPFMRISSKDWDMDFNNFDRRVKVHPLNEGYKKLHVTVGLRYDMPCN